MEATMGMKVGKTIVTIIGFGVIIGAIYLSQKARKTRKVYAEYEAKGYTCTTVSKGLVNCEKDGNSIKMKIG